MDGHGQPALLYLVPCTLGMNFFTPFDHLVKISFCSVNYMCLQISGTCVVLGLIRGELKQLWRYGTDDTREPASPGEA